MPKLSTTPRLMHVTNDQALSIQSMAKRMLYRRLRLRSITMQQCDIDDILQDSLIKALQAFALHAPGSASDIRCAIWRSVRNSLADWIQANRTTPVCDCEPRCTHRCSAPRFDRIQYESDLDVDSVADPDEPDNTWPPHLTALCQSVPQLRAAICFAGFGTDGAVYQEMTIEHAAKELGYTDRHTKRMMKGLRQSLAILAPENPAKDRKFAKMSPDNR